MDDHLIRTNLKAGHQTGQHLMSRSEQRSSASWESPRLSCRPRWLKGICGDRICLAKSSAAPVVLFLRGKTTVNTLWEHHCREEMSLKEISTQDAYLVYGKNWILRRWGNLLLEDIKTIEVERWLRAAEVAELQTGPKPRSSALCRLCSRMPFVGSSVATIQFHREYRWGRGDREVRARASASVRSVKSRLWSCHQTRSNSV